MTKCRLMIALFLICGFVGAFLGDSKIAPPSPLPPPDIGYWGSFNTAARFCPSRLREKWIETADNDGPFITISGLDPKHPTCLNDKEFPQGESLVPWTEENFKFFNDYMDIP